jgi:hypothetical protein
MTTTGAPSGSGEGGPGTNIRALTGDTGQAPVETKLAGNADPGGGGGGGAFECNPWLLDKGAGPVHALAGELRKGVDQLSEESKSVALRALPEGFALPDAVAQCAQTWEVRLIAMAKELDVIGDNLSTNANGYRQADANAGGRMTGA